MTDNVLVLCGHSGAGKSYIERNLVFRGYDKIISYTTRPIREGEKNGEDYHFVSAEKFQQKLNEGFFAEHTFYNGNSYGCAIEDLKANAVVVLEPHGVRELKKHCPNAIIFLIKVSERERLIRLARRGDETMEIFRRIVSDQGTFANIEQDVDFVINGELPTDTIVSQINLQYKKVGK
ncbi:MAG: hypothetical protein WCO84_01300 [bacterium]